jgi:hypothetical protein
VTRISDGINHLVSQYGKVAIWGINSYIYSLTEKLTEIPSDQIVFVDKSEMRQGLVVSGYTIRSTDLINQAHIKCIVVAVVQYYAGLIEPIRNEFPDIERLLCISDLLIDDFSITRQSLLTE